MSFSDKISKVVANMPSLYRDDEGDGNMDTFLF